MNFLKPSLSILMSLTGAHALAATLTFTNTNPAVQVSLVANSSVSIGVDGNLSAQCVLNGTTCAGFPASSSNTLTSTLSATGFSMAPNSSGAYPSGTSLTVNSSFGGNTAAEVCVRSLTAGTPAVNGWSGVVSAPFSGVSVTLSQAGATYGFVQKCFGTGSSAISNTLTIRTAAPVAPPPNGDQCYVPVVPPVGYTRISPTSFPALQTIPSGYSCGDFPNTGSRLCRLTSQRNGYVSLRFTVPTDPSAFPDSRQIKWLEAQGGGEANLNLTFMTISQCPGDFRMPPVGDAPSTDPTFAQGCRNIRTGGVTRGINYKITGGVSGTNICSLIPGQTYYFNMILTNPAGGILRHTDPDGAEPITCLNTSANSCGIQLRAL